MSGDFREPITLDPARILQMMRSWIWIPVALVTVACGSSPSAPSVVAVPPVTQAVIATGTCPTAPLVGFSLDLGFYQQIACNAFDGPQTITRRWMQAPKLYLRTVDDAGAAIDAVTLDTVQSAMMAIATSLTGGKFGLASVERGTDTREGQSGYITVKWAATAQIFCGDSDVAKDGGVIDFSPKTAGCSCNGSVIRPRTAKHELGHAFGYWHTDSASDLMSNPTVKPCDQDLSAREQQAVAYHYR